MASNMGKIAKVRNQTSFFCSFSYLLILQQDSIYVRSGTDFCLSFPSSYPLIHLLLFSSQVHITNLQNDLPKYAGWGVPAVIGAAWMIFPAIPDQYKGILAPEKTVTNAPHYKWDEVDNMPVVKG